MHLSGELDLANAGTVESALMTAHRPHTVMIVDLSELTFCDAAGISGLLRVARRCRNDGGELIPAAAAGIVIVADVLTITHIDEVTEVRDAFDNVIHAPHHQYEFADHGR
jgi:anti-anti-sigma factor